MNVFQSTAIDDTPIDEVHAHLIAYRAANFWYQRNYHQIKARAGNGDVLCDAVIEAEQTLDGSTIRERDYIMQCAVLCDAYGDVMMPVGEVTIISETEQMSTTV